jgi:radical SAM protein with 4Fe4S-binding SPASM domain
MFAPHPYCKRYNMIECDVNDIIKDDLRIALNPQLRMRKDIDRIYIFPVNPFTYQEKNKRIYIKPAEAVTLALFDGKKRIIDVVSDITNILHITEDTATRIIRNILRRYNEYMVDVDRLTDEVITYDPVDFIIPKEKIDTHTIFPKIPEIIMFIPTFACNFACRYCYAPKSAPRNVLHLEIIDSFLKQLAKWKLPSLFFSGGDPFCHPHITDILQLCVNNKIKPIIPTKSILTRDQIACLQKLGIDEIQMSIDTIQPQKCCALLGARESYINDMLQQIRFLTMNGIKVYSNSVLTSSTIHAIPLLVEHLYALGVRRMSFSQYSRSLFCHQDELFCRPESYEWLDHEIQMLQQRFPQLKISYKNMKDPTFMTQKEKEVFFQNRPNCTAGKMGVVILPDGRVTVCETLYYNSDLMLGDLQQTSIEDIWNSAERHNIITRSPQNLTSDVCTSCPEVEYCYLIKGKCYVRALQAYGSVKMPDPYCPKSPAGRRIL